MPVVAPVLPVRCNSVTELTGTVAAMLPSMTISVELGGETLVVVPAVAPVLSVSGTLVNSFTGTMVVAPAITIDVHEKLWVEPVWKAAHRTSSALVGDGDGDGSAACARRHEEASTHRNNLPAGMVRKGERN